MVKSMNRTLNQRQFEVKMLKNRVLTISGKSFEKDIEKTNLGRAIKGVLIIAVDRLLVHKTRARHNIFERLVETIQAEVETVIIDGIPYDLTIIHNEGKSYHLKLELKTESVSVSG